jgi:hypothetical protein
VPPHTYVHVQTASTHTCMRYSDNEHLRQCNIFLS